MDHQVTGAADGWVEALLVRLRLLAAVVPLAVALLYPDVVHLVAVLLSVAIVAYAIALHRLGERGDRRVAPLGLALDLAAATGLLLASLPDREAPAAALFPVIVFELVLRYGSPGIWAGVLVLAAALGLRIAHRAVVFELPARSPLLLLFWVTTCVLVLLALLFRARERERLAAVEEKQRLAEAFGGAVREILGRANVPPEAIEWRSLEELLAVGCATTPQTSREIAGALARLLLPPPEIRRLSQREREVLELLRGGCSSQQIADRLGLSAGTVRAHISNLVHKLGVGDRGGAIRLARGEPVGGDPLEGRGAVSP